MEKEAVAKAFYPFEREGDEQSTGTGLGLAIANSIAKFHQVTLNISSEKHKGTIVSIAFHINELDIHN